MTAPISADGTSSDPLLLTMRAAIGPDRKATKAIGPGDGRGSGNHADGRNDNQHAGPRDPDPEGSGRIVTQLQGFEIAGAVKQQTAEKRERKANSGSALFKLCAVDATSQPAHRLLQVPCRRGREDIGDDALQHRGNADADEDQTRSGNAVSEGERRRP